MLEHGKEWEAHQRTRAHRRLVKKAERGPEWEEWVRKKEEREAKVRGEASNVGNPAGYVFKFPLFASRFDVMVDVCIRRDSDA